MTVTTRGEKQTSNPPMSTKVESNREKKEFKVEEAEQPKDKLVKEEKVVENIILMPHPLPRFPQ